MIIKHKSSFRRSEVMRELEKMAIREGRFEPTPEQLVKTAAEKQTSPKIEPTGELDPDIGVLVSSLRRKGYNKLAEDIADKFVIFKQAQNALYNVNKESNEDFLNLAHPDGDVSIADAKEELGKVETVMSAAKKIREIAEKTPQGKEGSKTRDGLQKAAAEVSKFVGLNEAARIVEPLNKATRTFHSKVPYQSFYNVDWNNRKVRRAYANIANIAYGQIDALMNVMNDLGTNDSNTVTINYLAGLSVPALESAARNLGIPANIISRFTSSSGDWSMMSTPILGLGGGTVDKSSRGFSIFVKHIYDYFHNFYKGVFGNIALVNKNLARDIFANLVNPIQQLKVNVNPLKSGSFVNVETVMPVVDRVYAKVSNIYTTQWKNRYAGLYALLSPNSAKQVGTWFDSFADIVFNTKGNLMTDAAQKRVVSPEESKAVANALFTAARAWKIYASNTNDADANAKAEFLSGLSKRFVLSDPMHAKDVIAATNQFASSQGKPTVSFSSWEDLAQAMRDLAAMRPPKKASSSSRITKTAGKADVWLGGKATPSGAGGGQVGRKMAPGAGERPDRSEGGEYQTVVVMQRLLEVLSNGLTAHADQYKKKLGVDVTGYAKTIGATGGETGGQADGKWGPNTNAALEACNKLIAVAKKTLPEAQFEPISADIRSYRSVNAEDVKQKADANINSLKSLIYKFGLWGSVPDDLRGEAAGKEGDQPVGIDWFTGDLTQDTIDFNKNFWPKPGESAGYRIITTQDLSSINAFYEFLLTFLSPATDIEWREQQSKGRRPIGEASNTAGGYDAGMPQNWREYVSQMRKVRDPKALNQAADLCAKQGWNNCAKDLRERANNLGSAAGKPNQQLAKEEKRRWNEAMRRQQPRGRAEYNPDIKKLAEQVRNSLIINDPIEIIAQENAPENAKTVRVGDITMPEGMEATGNWLSYRQIEMAINWFKARAKSIQDYAGHKVRAGRQEYNKVLELANYYVQRMNAIAQQWNADKTQFKSTDYIDPTKLGKTRVGDIEGGAGAGGTAGGTTRGTTRGQVGRGMGGRAGGGIGVPMVRTSDGQTVRILFPTSGYRAIDIVELSNTFRTANRQWFRKYFGHGSRIIFLTEMEKTPFYKGAPTAVVDKFLPKAYRQRRGYPEAFWREFTSKLINDLNEAFNNWSRRITEMASLNQPDINKLIGTQNEELSDWVDEIGRSRSRIPRGGPGGRSRALPRPFGYRTH
jgi:hypothetical protein